MSLDLDRIARLAAEYDDDPSVPEMTMEQATVLYDFCRATGCPILIAET